MLTATRRHAKTLLITVITVIFIVFAVVNRQVVTVSLFPLPFEAQMPQFLLAIICFGLGVITGGALISRKLSRTKKLAKKEHKQVMALQNEVQALQARQASHMPVFPAHH